MTQDTAIRLWNDYMGWNEDGDFFREHLDDLGLNDDEQYVFGKTVSQYGNRHAARFLRSMATALDGGSSDERCINQRDDT